MYRVKKIEKQGWEGGEFGGWRDVIGWCACKFNGTLRPQDEQVFSFLLYHRKWLCVQIYGLVGENWWNFNVGAKGGRPACFES